MSPVLLIKFWAAVKSYSDYVDKDCWISLSILIYIMYGFIQNIKFEVPISTKKVACLN